MRGKCNLSLEIQEFFLNINPEVSFEKRMEWEGYQQEQCSLFDLVVWIKEEVKIPKFID